MKLQSRYSMRKATLLALLPIVVTMRPVQGASPMVNAQRDGTNVVIHFSGRLQSSSRIEGPYTNVLSASSPHLAPLPGTSNAFWRTVLNGVRTIAAGGSHSAAVKTDGTLWTWGSNSDGQLGIGSEPNRDFPVQVGNHWLSVALGQDHTVALRTDGTLWAWGKNTSGQLGLGTTNNADAPIRVGTDTNWESIAAGTAHTLAIRTDGTLWAWGDNRFGQLGIGTTNNAHQPVQVGAEANWHSVAAGGGLTGLLANLIRDLRASHSVALKNDGTLWAWGDNQFGQLGNATYERAFEPVRVGTNSHWEQVDAGGNHTTALDTEGYLWSWGENNLAQLGFELSSYTTNQPVLVPTTNQWRAIAAGGEHTMALRKDGALWACGSPAQGQLGVGTTINEYGDRYIPGSGIAWHFAQVGANTGWEVGADAGWQAVAAGEAHTLALRTDGTLWAWGYSRAGQLGNNTNRYDPTYQIGVETNWQTVAAGGGHALGLRNDGTLWAWAWNERGQLGLGTYFDINVPTQVGTNANWRMVSAGNDHTAAIRTDGTLWTWGWNNTGQLGNGTTRTTNSPVQVGTDSNWRLVSAGGYSYGAAHTMAIREDGTLWAWGWNQSGQLGIGSNTNATQPVQVGTDNNWRFVSAGVRHTVAIRTDGTLWAWGGSSGGALGLGEDIDFSTKKPLPVGTDTNWRTVVAGELRTTAVRTDGTLWAWGYTIYFGGATNRPFQIGTDANWQTVSGHAEHALALRADGTVWGRLDASGPVQVGTDAGWDVVAAGREVLIGWSFGLALRNGTLWTWGFHFTGAMGRPVPWRPYPVSGSDWWAPGN